MSWTEDALRIAKSRKDAHYASVPLVYSGGFVPAAGALVATADHSKLRLIAGFLNPAARKWTVRLKWICQGKQGSMDVKLPKAKSIWARDVDRLMDQFTKEMGQRLDVQLTLELLGGDDDEFNCCCEC